MSDEFYSQIGYLDPEFSISRSNVFHLIFTFCYEFIHIQFPSMTRRVYLITDLAGALLSEDRLIRARNFESQSSEENVETGFISWSPGVTGELICALLGLPVVLLGLGLLVRSHFRDTQLPYQTIQPPDVQPHEACHR